MTNPLRLLEPKGLDFTKLAISLALGKGSISLAHQLASARYGSEDKAAQTLKSAIPVGQVAEGSNWGSQLVGFASAANEFFAFVASQTIIGRLAARRVPFRVPLLAMSASASAYWTAQAKKKPMTRMTFTKETLEELKVAAMTAVSNELLKSTDPRAEGWIRTELARAMIEILDVTFINPSILDVENESPASILSDGTPSTTSGSIDDDLMKLIGAHGGDLTTSVFIMSAYAGANANSEANPLIGARGGEAKGIPVLTSESVPPGVVAILDAQAVAIAESGSAIRVSTEASVELEDDPSGSPVASTLVSLWQTNATGIICERFVNWAPIRSGHAAYIDDAAWAIAPTVT